ncbi:MAG TPA: PKD domain-containing protein [Candidatus Saccharimonadales bacterium]|nr:PKD domain-containing protein [Candidatus Saccharimonadales bacterium]
MDSAKFYIKKTGSPTGNIVAKLYTATGTFGSSNTPSTLLATSDNVSVPSLSSSASLVSFLFSGSDRIFLTAATTYCLSIEYSTASTTDYPSVGASVFTDVGDGNLANFLGSWSAQSTSDMSFYIYGVIAPATSLITSQTNVVPSETITFTDTSTDHPTSWSWNFGDGTTSTSQNPTHSYSATGTYTVTLIATNAAGSNSTTTTITVVNKPALAGLSSLTGVSNLTFA